MRIRELFIGVGIASILCSAVTTLPAAAQSSALVVVTRVQNISTNSVLADANDTDNALIAKAGNVLRYEVEVSAAEGELAQVKLTDQLPEGIHLVSNAKQRVIEENLGTVTATKIVKEYKVVVERTANEAIIDNKACAQADGMTEPVCDTAKVKVAASPKAVSSASATQPAAPTAAASSGLPQSGAGALGALIGTSTFGYAVHAYRRSKHRLRRSLIRK